VGTITLSTQSGGALANGTTYYVTAAAYNRCGNATPGSIVSLAAGAGGALGAAFAQVAGADGYDIFLSTSATGPLWVGRITEGQRASGIVISAVGTTSAGGAAGTVYINVVGTGLASNVLPFTVNNSYTPGAPAPLGCEGYSIAHLHVKMVVTDLRSLPTLVLIPFYQDRLSNNDWFAGALQQINLLTAAGQPLAQDFTIPVDGATNLVILVDTITGQGAAVTVWVELA
jgi:hypothetical protein